MLVIQSGFKMDLENDRSIFILYMSDGELTYHTSIDFNLIKDAKSAQQVVDQLVPMLNILTDAIYKGKDKLEDQEKTKKEAETIQ